MPSKRVRKPTKKAAEPPPPPPIAAPAQKRARQQKSPPKPHPRSPSPLSSPAASFPPPSAQPAAPIPPPPTFLVQYSVFFEHIELKKHTELGGATGSFSPAHYSVVSLDIAEQKAGKEGLATHLVRNEVSIKPLGGKEYTWTLDWRPATSIEWAMRIKPIINQIASHPKKGQDPTVNLKIESVFSRYEGRLPVAAEAASASQSTATASQQTAQELRTEASKTLAKRARSTTEVMLAESRERDKLTCDSVSIMPLMKRWKCSLVSCHSFQVSGECYVGRDGIHYRLPRHILGAWAKYIKAGQADMEYMPPDLLQELRPARAPRGKDKTPALSMLQPFGHPYMMPPPAAMYPSPYSWLPPYMGGAAPFPSFPPIFHPQQQQQQQQQQQPGNHVLPGLPATSSPPALPDDDVDDLVQGYFDWMIKKYPRQETELRRIASIMHGEAFELPDVRMWAKNLEENAKLAGIPVKLRERIDKNYKPYLQFLERQRLQDLRPIQDGQRDEQRDKQRDEEDLEDLVTQFYDDISEID
ncbi:hypothetical protein MMC10_003941 [Thelotrema lepadinum]|nr:hypothetical protein [Thelotrema lepadinum]